MREEIKRIMRLASYFEYQLSEIELCCIHKGLNIRELISRQGFSVILSVNGNASIEPRIGQILVYDAAADSSNANTKLRLKARR